MWVVILLAVQCALMEMRAIQTIARRTLVRILKVKLILPIIRK